MATNDVPRVDGYGDLREIGRGGFSTVYSADQDRLHRRVALKVINSVGEEARRFEREAAAVGVLSEVPHTVPAFAVTTTSDGRPVLVMPLMHESLAQRVARSGPCSGGVVAPWAAQLAAGVHGAHLLGILHRDIKPENVLLSTAGDAHLADFGIASFGASPTSTTTSNSLSPPHAPPERFTGSHDEGPSGDLYSLASTLYTALAGRPPFGTSSDGGTLGLMRRVAETPVAPIPHLGADANELLALAMAKDPQQRPTDIRSWAAELSDALAAERPDDPIELTRRRDDDLFRAPSSGRFPMSPPLTPPPYRGSGTDAARADDPSAAEHLERDEAAEQSAGATVQRNPAPPAESLDATPDGAEEPQPPRRRRRSLVLACIGLLAAPLLAFACWPEPSNQVAISDDQQSATDDGPRGTERRTGTSQPSDGAAGETVPPAGGAEVLTETTTPGPDGQISVPPPTTLAGGTGPNPATAPPTPTAPPTRSPGGPATGPAAPAPPIGTPLPAPTTPPPTAAPAPTPVPGPFFFTVGSTYRPPGVCSFAPDMLALKIAPDINSATEGCMGLPRRMAFRCWTPGGRAGATYRPELAYTETWLRLEETITLPVYVNAIVIDEFVDRDALPRC